MKKTNIFIATKPQELLVSQIICSKFQCSVNILLLVECFQGANTLADKVKTEFLIWDHVLIVNDYRAALRKSAELKFNRLFWDGDVGFKKLLQSIYLKIFVKNSSIFVYEEGWGVYRNDFYKGFKKRIFKFFGVGLNFGANKFVDGIYVFDKLRYLSSVEVVPENVFQIEQSLYDNIVNNLDKYREIFDVKGFFDRVEVSKLNKNICCVYLTSWVFNEVEFNVMTSKNPDGLFILKMHPRLKKIDLNAEDLNNILISPRDVPAELLIIALMKKFDKIKVFHSGSSAEWYLSSKTQVEFIRYEI